MNLTDSNVDNNNNDYIDKVAFPIERAGARRALITKGDRSCMAKGLEGHRAGKFQMGVFEADTVAGMVAIGEPKFELARFFVAHDFGDESNGLHFTRWETDQNDSLAGNGWLA